MDLEFEGRRALVTGASRGLGRAIALALVNEGAEVLAVSRNPARLRELAADAVGDRGSLETRVCDLGDGAAIDALGDLAAQQDVLVLNTGAPRRAWPPRRPMRHGTSNLTRCS